MDLNSEIKRLQQNLLATVGYIQCLQEIQDLLREYPKANAKSLRKYLAGLELKKGQERQQNMGGLQLAQRLSGSEQPARKNQDLPDLGEDDLEEVPYEEDSKYSEDSSEEIEVSVSKQRPQIAGRRSGLVSFSLAESGRKPTAPDPLTDDDREFYDS